MKRPYVVAAILFISVSWFSACSRDESQEDQATLKHYLFQAVKVNDVPTVEDLLRQGVKVNEPETPSGWTALRYAVAQANPDMVRVLIAAGANPNVTIEVAGHPPEASRKLLRAFVQSEQSKAILTFALTPESDRERKLALSQATVRYDKILEILDILDSGAVDKPTVQDYSGTESLTPRISSEKSSTFNCSTEFSVELETFGASVAVELREGVPGKSQVVSAQKSSGGQVRFVGLCAGSYFLAIGDSDTVSVTPVRSFESGALYSSRVVVQQGAGNVSRRSRQSL